MTMERCDLDRDLARLRTAEPVPAHLAARPKNDCPFPVDSGVYAFEEGGRFLYVGTSSRLKKGLWDHIWPTAERNIPGRSSRPFCTLALALAEEAIGRKVCRWPPPETDRTAVLEALCRVREMGVRFLVEPDRQRLKRCAVRELSPEYNRRSGPS